MKKRMFKWWARLSAIFLTFWGMESGYIAVRNVIAENVAIRGFFIFDVYAIFTIALLFLSQSILYLLPSLPMWYYGFRKD